MISAVQAAAPTAGQADRQPLPGKLNFVASLQVGAQLSGWYLLNTYLQRRLRQAIHFEQLPAGHDLTDGAVDILFAKPFEACAMIRARRFLPVLRPQGRPTKWWW